MITGISGSEYQDQSQGSLQTGTGSDVNKDEFLRLLTYQLKNQNPLKPYDNQEFASQLAQFSQLEQMTDIKSLMEEQVQTNMILTQTISNTALPGLLGKSAKALLDSISYDGDNPVKLGYSLPVNAADGKIVINDEYGNTVRTIQLSPLDMLNGDHKIEWDGTDDEGNEMPAGNYSFSLEAADASGEDISADTFVYGKIEAVRFKTDGTKLVIGGIEVPLENVMDISTEG